MRFLLLVLALLVASWTLVRGSEEGGLVVSHPPLPEGFNPYVLLNVKRNVALPQLKRAHKAAKKAANGEEQRKHADLAFEVLVDAAWRAKFDAEHPPAPFELPDEEEEQDL